MEQETVVVDAVATSADGEPALEMAPPPQNTKKMIHTRSCNRREVCSCFLRLQSAYFQKNLVAQCRKKKQMRDEGNVNDEDGAAEDGPVSVAVAVNCEPGGDDTSITNSPLKKKRAMMASRRSRAVTNLQLLDIEAKQLIAMFLLPADLAKLSMVRARGVGSCQSYSCITTESSLLFFSFVGE